MRRSRASARGVRRDRGRSRRSKKRGLALKRVRGGGLHRGSIALELDEILAAGGGGGAGGVVVGLTGVEADEAAGEVGLGEQRAGGRHFVFFGHREHRCDEADDLREAVGDGLAVEGEGRGQLAVLGL